MYNDVFVKNDTLKLYDKTLKDMSKALEIEKAFQSDLEDKVKQMKDLLHEEQIQRDELKQLQMLQRKQIDTLGIKHDRNTSALERNLNGMNDCINDAVQKGHVSIK